MKKTLFSILAVLAIASNALAADPASVPDLPLLLGADAILQAPPNNPSQLAFTASTDHNTVQLGADVLTNYVVKFYLTGATTPNASPSIGKPTPDATNTITVDLKTLSRQVPVAGTYTAVVSSVGPGGSSDSLPTDPFSLSPLPPTAVAGKPVIKQ